METPEPFDHLMKPTHLETIRVAKALMNLVNVMCPELEYSIVPLGSVLMKICKTMDIDELSFKEICQGFVNGYRQLLDGLEDSDTP